MKLYTNKQRKKFYSSKIAFPFYKKGQSQQVRHSKRNENKMCYCDKTISFVPISEPCILGTIVVTYWFWCDKVILIETWYSMPAAAAKSLQWCPTLCNPRDGSPPGSPVPGILQARTLEWAAISFSNAWKWKVKVKSLSRVWLLATPRTAAHQAPPSMGFSRQEYWSGVPLPSPTLNSTFSYLIFLSWISAPCAFFDFSTPNRAVNIIDGHYSILSWGISEVIAWL